MPDRVLAVAVGTVAAVGIGILTGFIVIAVGAGVLAGTAAWIVADVTRARRSLRLEEQLADAIDLLVGALRAGVGVQDALAAAAHEAPPPLRSLLDQVVGRLRLGDAPAQVFADLAASTPLEAFRLFSFALTVHFEVGGGLARTLASVGRSVRDGIEVGRRVKTQAAEAQFSVGGILVILYGIAALMWSMDEGRMEGFLEWDLGAWIVSIAVALQAVGLLWMVRLTRIAV